MNKKDLKYKSIKAFKHVGFGNLIAIFIVFAKGILMARILAPEDFGIIALLIVFTSFGDLLVDAGISTVVIQKKEINNKQLSFLFYSNIFIGILCFVISQILVNSIANFYENTELIMFARVYFFSFVLSSVYPVHMANFKRNVNLKIPTYSTLFSQFVSLFVGIIFGLMGFGAWSLVLMMLFYHTAMIFSILYFSNLKLKFDIKFFHEENFKLLINGLNLLGFNLVNYFSRNVDKILIGKIFGVNSLGFYTKSYELSSLPINKVRAPIESVVLPILTRLRNDTLSFNLYYKYYLKSLMLIIWASVLPIILFSEEIIFYLLGDKWIEMNDVFVVLLINSLFQSIAGTRGIVMISNELNKRYFYWGLANAILTIFVFYIGSKYSFLEMAIIYTSYNIIIIAPSLFYCFKDTQIKVFTFFKNIFLLLLCLVVIFIITFYIKNILNFKLYAIIFYLISILFLIKNDKDINHLILTFLKKK